MRLILPFFLLLFLFPSKCFAQQQTELLDSIYQLRALTRKGNYTKEARIKYANRAVLLSKKTQYDSTILNSQRVLAYTYLITGEYKTYQSLTLEILKKGRAINDSLAIANSCNTLGYYYYQIESDNNKAYKYYLEAFKYFDALNNNKKKAYILTTLASIQDDEKDYLGSEQNAIKALRILNSLSDKDYNPSNKYNILNLLGLVSLKLKNYEESINFHNEAIGLTKELENGKSLAIESLNNLAFTSREKGDYKKALEIFSDIIENPLLKEDMSFYGLVLDNYSFTKFLSGNYNYSDVENNLKEALRISESIEDEFTRLAASIDLAKFYKGNKNKDSSYKYATQSYKLAKEIPINDLYLESMLILSDLTEGDKSKSYLEQHIALSDSLLAIERMVRNKFARLEYKTDELEAENEQISKENLYLVLLSIGLLLAAVIVYSVISQRAKNRKLKLIKVQQKANEDIYNLMLGQQDKVDEARAKEKARISGELHDGVLGRLFGTRLSLDSMNFSDGKEAMMNRAKYIGELKTIEDDIRKISHELNTDFVSGTSFMDIVTELIENQTQAYNLTYDFNYTDDISWDLVANKTKINIYRIIQESMHNIYKHANAKAIKISVSLENNVICLDIIDDGDGFDISKSKKGIGLKNMTTRVKDIDGNIVFKSRPNQGTKIEVTVPYTNKLA